MLTTTFIFSITAPVPPLQTCPEEPPPSFPPLAASSPLSFISAPSSHRPSNQRFDEGMKEIIEDFEGVLISLMCEWATEMRGPLAITTSTSTLREPVLIHHNGLYWWCSYGRVQILMGFPMSELISAESVVHHYFFIVGVLHNLKKQFIEKVHQDQLRLFHLFDITRLVDFFKSLVFTPKILFSMPKKACELVVRMGSSSVVINDLNFTFLFYTPICRDEMHELQFGFVKVLDYEAATGQSLDFDFWFKGFHESCIFIGRRLMVNSLNLVFPLAWRDGTQGVVVFTLHCEIDDDAAMSQPPKVESWANHKFSMGCIFDHATSTWILGKHFMAYGYDKIPSWMDSHDSRRHLVP
ncbi:hypothetical protein Scep_023717 [Stephania cephalantha]|uniref:Uncharacterized protein n=1 Tax=Stephania cephalantha TaxID=152367 RepID=A0AAP0HWI3_9MAGN